jgi:hypothetical protein
VQAKVMLMTGGTSSPAWRRQRCWLPGGEAACGEATCMHAWGMQMACIMGDDGDNVLIFQFYVNPVQSESAIFLFLSF